MSPSSKETCLADLRARILTCDLAPGSDLDETGVAAQYGLSRTPLREVYQRLSADGYLRLEINRGARVAPLDLTDLRHLFRVAPLIHATLARLASGSHTPKQMDAAREVQALYLEALAADDAGSPARAALLNHQLHLMIGEMAFNSYLMPALTRLVLDETRLSLPLHAAATKKDRKALKKAALEHDALLRAIELGDAVKAVEVAQSHCANARKAIERHFHPDALRPEDVGEPADAA